MARTILAAVAALCALASVSAFSVLPDPTAEPQQLPPQLQQLFLQLGQQLEKLLPSELGEQLEKLLPSELGQQLGSELSPQNLKDRAQDLLEMNASFAQGLLTGVIHSSLDDNVKGIKQALQDVVVPDALQIGAAHVKEWLDKANLTGVDVSNCVDDGKANLTDVVKTFQHAAGKCIEASMAELDVLGTKIRAIWEAAKSIQGQQVLEACGEPLKGRSDEEFALCELKIFKRLLLLSGEMSIDALYSGSLPIDALKCIIEEFASALPEASHIANATISCIEGKLSSQSS